MVAVVATVMGNTSESLRRMDADVEPTVELCQQVSVEDTSISEQSFIEELARETESVVRLIEGMDTEQFVLHDGCENLLNAKEYEEQMETHRRLALYHLVKATQTKQKSQL